MFQCYVNFLEEHESKPGELVHLKNLAIIAKEEVNLETVLLRALELNHAPIPLTTVIHASRQFCQYQYHTRPRSDVATAAVRAASNENCTTLLPTMLYVLGELDRLQCKYDEARGSLQQARNEFEQLGNRMGAAQCLRILDLIPQAQSSSDDARRSPERP
jgi:hypothetical protein